jgi:chromosome segregation ATPase
MKVSAKVLEEYKDIIATTKLDLEQHLEAVIERLETLPQAAGSDTRIERHKCMDEVESTKLCIKICEEVTRHIDERQSTATGDTQSSSSARSSNYITYTQTAAELMTVHSLKRCRADLTGTRDKLKEKLKELNERHDTQEAATGGAESGSSNESRVLQAELQSLRERLVYLQDVALRTDQYRTNYFERVNTVEDAQQVVVSTIGDLISAKGISVGPRATQWLGQMSDETVQVLSHDRGIRLESTAVEQNPLPADFELRHGVGKPLNTGDTGVINIRGAN